LELKLARAYAVAKDRRWSQMTSLSTAG